ncbi:MAG: histidinol-phosphatase HisJ family protein [Ruminococcus sp.]|nr:histidinol-phosphatase HisJ family protein [Ruminococcus sp.]
MVGLGIDCHTHTGVSPDGKGTAGGLCRSAISQGLQALAITEHIELNRWFTEDHYGISVRNKDEQFGYSEVMEKAMKQCSSIKDNYGSRIHIISGIELGQPHADFGLAEAVMHDCRLDYVIASLHELHGKADFYCLNYERESVSALMEQYFKELLQICQWGKFDVLGHMTYPLRYIEGEHHIPVDLNEYEEQIRACLKALVEHGCGLEINTSGLRQPYGKPFPTMDILKIYREYGGEMVTIGSDAHRAEDVGKGVQEGIQMASEAGFPYLCYFHEREPIYIKIV